MNGHYVIVMGERRYRSSKLASKKTIPCIVKNYENNDVLEVQIIENLQRKDVEPTEEAEAIADRVGVIAHGALLLVEDKAKLMARMGKKQLEVQLSKPIKALPKALQSDALTLSEDGTTLIYTYDTRAERTGITKLLADVSKAGLVLTDVMTRQSSLEDIFVDLVQEDAA